MAALQNLTSGMVTLLSVINKSGHLYFVVENNPHFRYNKNINIVT